MNILITGGCGFVGTNLAIFLKKKNFNVFSLDNLSRIGSLYNLNILKKNHIKNFKIDIYDYKKIKRLSKFNLIIDCCAEAAVEISRKNLDKVFNTNLIGTFNILKKARKDKSKIIFLSSSRVNSIDEINKITNYNFNLKKKITSKRKINEKFSTESPKSIYGFTKHASEMLIQEFAYAFRLDYIIDRCGVISGPLQFGKEDQGFVSLWVWHHVNKKKLKYIGFGGNGHQVRDVLHVDDFCELILKQIKNFKKIKNKLFTVGGSTRSNTSLKDLTKVCEKKTGNKIHFSKKSKTSIYDISYFISNNKQVSKVYNWRPKKNINNIVHDIYEWIKKDYHKLKIYLR